MFQNDELAAHVKLDCFTTLDISINHRRQNIIPGFKTKGITSRRYSDFAFFFSRILGEYLVRQGQGGRAVHFGIGPRFVNIVPNSLITPTQRSDD
jgi:hypothetical protein